MVYNVTLSLAMFFFNHVLLFHMLFNHRSKAAYHRRMRHALAFLIISCTVDVVAGILSLRETFIAERNNMIALSLVLLLTSLFRSSDANAKGAPKPQSAARLLAVIGFIAAYIALINYLGFFAATEIFLVSFMIAMKATTPVKAVIISTVVTGLLYLFFSVVLMVPTPRGLLI